MFFDRLWLSHALLDANLQFSVLRPGNTAQYFPRPTTCLGAPVAVVWLSLPEGIVDLLLALILPGEGAAF